MTTCSVDSCQRPVKARGWCNTHYARWRSHVDPAVIADGLAERRRRAGRIASSHRWPTRTVTERFWSHVDVRGPDECWPWTAAKRSAGGYGVFDNQVASRWSLAQSIGRDLTPDEYACHHCDNPPCVNPAHLFVGSAADNAADMIAKGRSSTGDRHGSHTRPETFRRYAKLTAGAIPSIRRRLASGEPVASVARDHGVSPWTIYDVAEGRTWKHVP